MAMRTDCENYASRTIPDGVVETCKIGATDETGTCPVDCPMFERRAIMIVGWEQGTAAVPLPEPHVESDPDETALLAELSALVEDSSDTAVAAEAERRHADQRRSERRKRRRIR